MQVEVKLYGRLRQYRPKSAGGALHHPFFVAVMGPVVINDLANGLGIPDGLVTAASLNGEAVEVTAVAQPDDKIGLFPPSAGG